VPIVRVEHVEAVSRRDGPSHAVQGEGVGVLLFERQREPFGVEGAKAVSGVEGSRGLSLKEDGVIEVVGDYCAF
jgi:hypothetical protein